MCASFQSLLFSGAIELEKKIKHIITPSIIISHKLKATSVKRTDQTSLTKLEKQAHQGNIQKLRQKISDLSHNRMHFGQVIKHEVCKQVTIMIMMIMMMMMTAIHETLTTFSQCVSSPPPLPKRGNFFKTILSSPFIGQKKNCAVLKKTLFASRTVSCC